MPYLRKMIQSRNFGLTPGSLLIFSRSLTCLCLTFQGDHPSFSPRFSRRFSLPFCQPFSLPSCQRFSRPLCQRFSRLFCQRFSLLFCQRFCLPFCWPFFQDQREASLPNLGRLAEIRSLVLSLCPHFRGRDRLTGINSIFDCFWPAITICTFDGTRARSSV